MSSPDAPVAATAWPAGRRVLGHVAPDGAPTVLGAPPRRLDDATRQLLERARAEARAQGHAEGLAQGRAELDATTDAVRAAVDAGVQELSGAVRDQHEALAVALESRVLDAVRAVLGHEPDDGGRALVAALRSAVAGIDAPTLEVRVPADRSEVVIAALADHPSAVVVVDPSLGPDDAAVTGPSVDVDLRRSRLLEELAEVLAASRALGPVAAGEGADDA